MRNGNQGVVEMSYIEKFWRPATAADVARVMAGETVEARFTQHNGSTTKSFIAGWKETPSQWMDSHGLFWDYCQVYAPPQYWLNKPDPGEGYRLLEKEPDEAKHRDDEIFREGRWDSVGLDDGKQREEFWYRRRIEPKPEPKFKVGQRVRIVGGISGPYIGKLATIEAMATDSSGWFYNLRYVEGSFREPSLEPAEPKHYTLQVGDTAEHPAGYFITITDYGYSAKTR